MSKFIRITERDKKHAESEVCKGSIGYVSEQKGLRIVNIFQDSIDAFGLTFYRIMTVNFIMLIQVMGVIILHWTTILVFKTCACK